MADINPYQAPQSLPPVLVPQTEAPDFAMGPEFLEVAKGARWCYTAVLIILLTMVVIVVFGVILDVLPKPALYALPLIVIAAGILHVLGVLKLSKIDEASGAKGLLLGAAVTAGINLVLMLIVNLAQLQKGGAQTAGVEALQSLAGAASNIMLMLGLLWIGDYCRSAEVRSKAKAALVSISLTYLLILVMIGLMVSTANGNGRAMPRLQNLPMNVIIAGVLVLCLSLFALISYTAALTALSKVPDLVFAARRSKISPQEFPGDREMPRSNDHLS